MSAFLESFGYAVIAPIPLWLFLAVIISLITQRDKDFDDFLIMAAICFVVITLVVSVLFSVAYFLF